MTWCIFFMLLFSNISTFKLFNNHLLKALMILWQFLTLTVNLNIETELIMYWFWIEYTFFSLWSHVTVSLRVLLMYNSNTVFIFYTHRLLFEGNSHVDCVHWDDLNNFSWLSYCWWHFAAENICPLFKTSTQTTEITSLHLFRLNFLCISHRNAVFMLWLGLDTWLR